MLRVSSLMIPCISAKMVKSALAASPSLLIIVARCLSTEGGKGSGKGSSLLLTHIGYGNIAGPCHGHYAFNIQMPGTM